MPVFLVIEDGWIGGRLRRAGERVSLAEAEAKYERVRPAEAEPEAAPPAEPAAEPVRPAPPPERPRTIRHRAEPAS